MASDWGSIEEDGPPLPSAQRRWPNPFDIVRSRDGSISLTKLAAATAHALVAIIFVRQQWNGAFNEAQWLIYLGCTILHAGYDKTSAMVKEVQMKKADAATVRVDKG